MASSTSNSIPLLLLLILTISSSSSLLLHARDSQFFSKVTNTPTQTNTEVLPDNQVTTQEQQQPDFIPQNQNEGHGLYGSQPDGLETTDTKSGVQTRTPATYASERYYNSKYNYNSDKNSVETEQFGNREGESFYTNNGEKYYQNDDASFEFDDSKDENDDASFYNNNHNGVETEHYKTYTNQKDNEQNYYYSNKDQNDDALYQTNNYNDAGAEHYTTESQKDNNNYLGETETYYSDKNNQFGNQLRQTETNYNDNRYTNELNTQYNTYRPDTTKTKNNGGSNVVRQGMSDTRFLENGRYYYDLNKEEQLQNRYAKQNTYKYNDVDQVNANYDDDDNNNNRFYDNSGGEKYEFNTMEEYEQRRQNQYDP